MAKYLAIYVKIKKYKTDGNPSAFFRKIDQIQA